MNAFASLMRDRRGSAAAEMALVVPFLLTLGMGSVELGNYFLDEHRLVKAVRDGARYAARQDFSNFSGCSATPSDVPDNLRSAVQAIVRTGQLSGGSDQLPNWSGATFSVQMTCSTTYGSQTMGGIYATHNSGQAPVVIVTASVPYRPVAVLAFGFDTSGYSLNAQQQAAVAGV